MNTASPYYPRFLVLLASYNGSLWIRDQLNSILNQVNVDVLIMVRDDFSDDNTSMIVESMAANDSRIMLYDSPQKTSSAGSNFKRLILDAYLENIDFVAFSDQDDIWFENKLYNAVNALGNGFFNGYSSAVDAFWPNGKIRTLRQSSGIKSYDFIFEGAGQGCTFVLPVQSFSKIQRFLQQNENNISNFHYHDWLVYLIVRAFGGTWYFDQSPSLLYRQHEENDTGAKVGFRSAIKRILLIKSGWYSSQILEAIHIYGLICHDNSINSLNTLINSDDSISKRFRLSYFLFFRSRRKLSERIVLTASSLFGWI